VSGRWNTVATSGWDIVNDARDMDGSGVSRVSSPDTSDWLGMGWVSSAPESYSGCPARAPGVSWDNAQLLRGWTKPTYGHTRRPRRLSSAGLSDPMTLICVGVMPTSSCVSLKAVARKDGSCLLFRLGSSLRRHASSTCLLPRAGRQACCSRCRGGRGRLRGVLFGRARRCRSA